MGNKILAILEQREGLLKKVSFEAASVASKLAKELNLETEAVVVGSDLKDLNEISKYGITKIV
ncbi:MAG: electron transfer flavoprotein subunit alpha/FixB family protein, partial [Ignavibacterium sp.]|nr:electron transfer flavoprotein subunit alpha/FixB family protein [Ignavibacterium sp.]